MLFPALMAAFGGAPGQINTSLPNGGAVNTSASFGINNDGTYLISIDQSGDWVTPNEAAGLYEVMVTEVSDSFDGGSPTGEWLSCATSRSWVVSDPGGITVKTVVFNIAWRSGGVVRAVQNNLQVQVVSTA